ncbi:glycosyl hydrolase [Fusarium redolens]|uniref:Glycosyl hydrolase n=1 Tax=Fusarium redolens TaxID=48865 RepID=A0A9P9GFV6_FUSRE|nr:glycosyl hydrolase [Fusarium redolens]KAH7237767.1 glycosyl hydrolase [Fusarium redolens]
MKPSNAEILYSNPIVPGFAPDPSVVFVDGTFFLCTSSFHVFPGLPIYASKDLRQWTHIGNALHTRSQLSLRDANTIHMPLDTGFTMVATTGIVAPSIHHHDGVFYIVTTNQTFNGEDYERHNFIIKCHDIWSNNWGDPVYFDYHGIDTSLFFHDDGRVFVQGAWHIRDDKQPTNTIKQVQIGINTGELLSETIEIWSGWAKYDTEGPHIYKVGEYFYLLAAEGGTFEHHMLTIARSKDIWGPYESWDQNPIMTADGKDEYIQNIGHGSLFQDGDGRWWAAVLGVRKQPNGTLGLGRESFLSPVDWPEGGWPTVRQPRMSFKREAVPSLVPQNPLQAPPHIEDLYIRDHDERKYRYLDDKETLHLIPSRHGLGSAIESPTFLGRRQRFLTGTGSTRITADQSLTGNSIRAGISLYKDPIRFASLVYDFDNTTVVFEVHNSATGLFGTVSRKLSSGLIEVQLQITATPSRYSFQVQETLRETEINNKGWIEIGSVETIALDARDFTGPLIGVFTQTLLQESKMEAIIFQEFKLQAQE